MSNKLLHNIKEVLYITVIWVVFTFFYVYIKFNDIPENYLSQIYNLQPGLSRAWLYRVSMVAAFPLGIILGLLHTFIYPKLNRSKGLFVNTVIRTVAFLMLTILVFFIITLIDSDNSAFATSHMPEILMQDPAIGIFIYTMVTENLVGLLILLRRSLGDNYFLNTIANTYRNPKEEKRVFMFLDLEDSTPTADKMGHLNFSKYIQDCFLDLSDIVLEHGGEIYQFVGDEAVITWKVYGKFDYVKCVDLYFSYRDYLNSKKDYYIQKHKYTPVFRCAIHSGKVSTALVGDYKKEIAYHGDVLNLCSRLQTACKENNAYVLASDRFCRNIANERKYVLQPLCLSGLKGIDNDQTAYKISLAGE